MCLNESKIYSLMNLNGKLVLKKSLTGLKYIVLAQLSR